MGLTNFLKGLFGGAGGADQGHKIEELARRLKIPLSELQFTLVSYTEFQVPKRSGGVRVIMAPAPKLKTLQRLILRKVLGRLKCHASVTGFERHHSIVTNAICHTGKAVVVRMDLKDFFPSTKVERVAEYFKKIGWNKEAREALVRLCAHKGGLPQGAPTSPRLTNLVNHRMDARLHALAANCDAVYTRYADDLTFSFKRDDSSAVRNLISFAKTIVADEGYQLHEKKKLHIRRQHDRQLVTGLVVNQRINLPRPTRRWLRAVEHHLATNRLATLSPDQLDGWRSLQSMIATQSQAS